jgi:hypothetical protein
MKVTTWFLFASVVALGLSVIFAQRGDTALAAYVAIWAPSFIGLAIYFKR